MTILDPSNLVKDLGAVVASIPVNQYSLLISLKAVIDLRLKELEEEKENDSERSQENTQA